MLQISEKIKNNKTIFSNFSYLAILEIFVLIAPLITYPYLVRVLGTELYGWVITAQVTASYASIIIDFGFRRVSAKYVASVRDNLRCHRDALDLQIYHLYAKRSHLCSTMLLPRRSR